MATASTSNTKLQTSGQEIINLYDDDGDFLSVMDVDIDNENNELLSITEVEEEYVEDHDNNQDVNKE